MGGKKKKNLGRVLKFLFFPYAAFYCTYFYGPHGLPTPQTSVSVWSTPFTVTAPHGGPELAARPAGASGRFKR